MLILLTTFEYLLNINFNIRVFSVETWRVYIYIQTWIVNEPPCYMYSERDPTGHKDHVDFCFFPWEIIPDDHIRDF